MSIMAIMLDEKLNKSVNVDARDEQWRVYITDNNQMVGNVEGDLRQLAESRSKLFCSPERMHVDIMDILGKAPRS